MEENTQMKSQFVAGQADYPPFQNTSLEIPYFERDGMLYHIRAGKRGEAPIASFRARIVSEIIEDEGRSFTVAGQTCSGHKFSFSIPVKEYFSDRMLAATILRTVGKSAVIYAGMSRHLPPAIQLLTKTAPRVVHRFCRTGWHNDQFLIPGGEVGQVEILLPEKLPYRLEPHADFDLGMKALDHLMNAQMQEMVSVALCTVFQAPIAMRMDWRNERYALFIIGRTGVFKTSIAQLLLSLYGKDFQEEHVLIRWGIGATVNSVISLSAFAADLPFLVDNYKPNTGRGGRDLINVVHALLEGGEKDRLRKDSSLRKSRSIHTWPIFTGEDTDTTDPATLVRMLVVGFELQDDNATLDLTEAQRLADHLNAVGKAWLDWIVTPEASICFTKAQVKFRDVRENWMRKLRGYQCRIVNPARVATNLASNQLTWELLSQHPRMGTFFKKYSTVHQVGLQMVAEKMARLTSEALEATRFLDALNALLSNHRCVLLPAFTQPRDADRDRHIGWQLQDGSICLLPLPAKDAVERVLGFDSLNGISHYGLYNQLAGLGFIANHDPGRHTKVYSIGGKGIRLLHLNAEALLQADAQAVTELPEFGSTNNAEKK